MSTIAKSTKRQIVIKNEAALEVLVKTGFMMSAIVILFSVATYLLPQSEVAMQVGADNIFMAGMGLLFVSMGWLGWTIAAAANTPEEK